MVDRSNSERLRVSCDRLTDGRTFVILASLLQLKRKETWFFCFKGVMIRLFDPSYCIRVAEAKINPRSLQNLRSKSFVIWHISRRMILHQTVFKIVGWKCLKSSIICLVLLILITLIFGQIIVKYSSLSGLWCSWRKPNTCISSWTTRYEEYILRSLEVKDVFKVQNA